MFRITCYDSEGYPITHLTQWDIDQTLVVEDSYITENHEKLPNFHFCNRYSTNALVVETKLDEQGRITAKVPNILLQQGTPIVAYVYIYGIDGFNGYSKSLYTIRLPVRPRPKPDDYIYIETEIITIQRLEEKLKKLIEEVATNLSAHIENKENPHEVDKEQVGLGNVPNVTTNDQTPTYEVSETLIPLTSGEKLSIAFGKIAKAIEELILHIGNKNNPHEVNKEQVGLGNVPNVNTNDQTPTYEDSETLEPIVSGETLSTAFGKISKAIKDFISHLVNKNNPHEVTKEQVGLDKVDNTSDLNKPVSNATQIELDKKAPIDSPAFTGTPTAPFPTTGTGIANKDYVDTAISGGIAAIDAMVFKGTIGTDGTITTLPAVYKVGWTYRVTTAGIYAGQNCEVGDLIIALVTRDGTDNADSDWTIAQTNIDGAITNIQGENNIVVSGTGSNRIIGHTDSGVSAGNYGEPLTATPKFGENLRIPTFTVDAKGHVTQGSNQEVTLPNMTASTTEAGLLSVEDKTKLDGIAEGANNYVHPTDPGNKHIPAGGTTGQILTWSEDGTAVWTENAGGSGGTSAIEVTKAEYDELRASGQLDFNAYYNILDDYDAITIINDKLAATNQVYSSSFTESTFVKKSLVISTTLVAANWTGSTAPYSLTLSVNGVTATNINELIYAKNCTEAQIKAYQECELKDGGQTTNQITLLATGKKPTIDIPVVIIVRKDS